ncbi:MAG TPA: spiro-SPASM protein [Spirochaetota bacterium]|nr:spiro-SPASM protein [Spirochaetota bacterium]
MKTLILDGIFAYKDFDKNFNGKTTLEIIFEKAKLNGFDRYILIQNGKISQTPSGIKNVILDSFDPETIIDAIISESLNSETVVVFNSGNPFYDHIFVGKMLERHEKYVSDYTYAIGYPEGLSPVILRGNIIKELKKLVENDDVVKKDYLFYALSKDINSFDIETFLSDYDLRIHRIKFGLSDAGEEVLTTKLFDIFKNNFTVDSLTEYLNNNLDKIYTVPYMLNIEITNYSTVKSAYLPEPKSNDKNFDFNLFKKTVTDFKKINDKFYLLLGGKGDPVLHENFYEILDFLNVNSIETVIETYGIDFDFEKLKSIDNFQNEKFSFVLKFDSYYEETYNKINLGGDFNRLQNAYKTLKENNFKVYKQIVRTIENEEEIEKYIKNKESDDLIIRKYSTFCSKLEDKKVVDLSPLERIPCFHLRREIFINSSGEVCFCSYNYEKIIGDLKSETSSQIVEKMKKLYEKNALGQYEDRCKNCDDYYIFNF